MPTMANQSALRRTKLVQVMVTEEERGWLEQLANVRGVSMADVVRLNLREQWLAHLKRERQVA